MERPSFSPYLILGLDYGATPDAARAAWARKVRLLKSSPDAQYDTEDLNAALYEIEHSSEDPLASVRWFRVPANRTGYSHGEGSTGLFRPAPIPLPRRTSPASAKDLEAAGEAAIRSVANTFVLTAVTATPCPNPYQHDDEE